MPRKLTCKQASQLCSAALDRPLYLRERLTLRVHLLLCANCTNYNKQMAVLRKITARFANGAFAGHDEAQPERSGRLGGKPHGS